MLFKSCGTTPTAKAVVAPTKVVTLAPVAPKTKPVAALISCDLQWILFDFDRYNIRTDASRELDELAALFKKHDVTIASLVVHTDARCSVAYNNSLSLNRSNEARKYLQQKGISAARIRTSAKSEADPYAKNTTDDSGRKYNRRVELSLLDADGKKVCDSKVPNISNALKVK